MLVAFLFLGVTGCTSTTEIDESPDISIWDQIITKPFFYQFNVKGQFSREATTTQTAYTYYLDPPADSPNSVFAVVIAVEPSKRDDTQDSINSFGPGGAAWSRHFITQDQIFSVSISYVQQALNDSFASQNVQALFTIDEKLKRAYCQQVYS